MIDCLEKVKDLLIFESEDDFYHLQILKRKKDDPTVGSNSVTIRSYYIESLDHLLGIYPEVKRICDSTNSRASLRLNRRSFEKIAFNVLKKISDIMMNRDYGSIYKAYDSVCGLICNEKTKKWIVDVDKDELVWKEEILSAIYNSEPVGDKVIVELPTKSGIHFITTPFHVVQFKEGLNRILRDKYSVSNVSVEIHKDNPINLYIP